MNYIIQLNNYWLRHEECSLAISEAGLYGYLLKRANDKARGRIWPDEVEVQNSVAMEFLNLSFRDLQKSRDKLKSAQLIDHQTRNGSKVVRYSFYDFERETFTKTFAANAKVGVEVTAKVHAEVGGKVGVEVIENTIVLLKHEPKPKPLIKSGEGISIKAFNLRGHPVKINAGDYLMQKFEERINQEFMKNFRELEQEKMLACFTDESFMKSYKDEDHMFNTFRKLCRDTLEANQKPGSKGNSTSIVKHWGG